MDGADRGEKIREVGVWQTKTAGAFAFWRAGKRGERKRRDEGAGGTSGAVWDRLDRFGASC